jgi:hypothetical protein
MKCQPLISQNGIYPAFVAVGALAEGCVPAKFNAAAVAPCGKMLGNAVSSFAKNPFLLKNKTTMTKAKKARLRVFNEGMYPSAPIAKIDTTHGKKLVEVPDTPDAADVFEKSPLTSANNCVLWLFTAEIRRISPITMKVRGIQRFNPWAMFASAGVPACVAPVAVAFEF